MATTTIPGAKQPFPRTDWSLVQDAADPAGPAFRDSMDQLATIYWRPIFGYLCRRWGKTVDEAKDLTQTFFLSLVQKGFRLHCSGDRGRFRSYVIASLDNLVRLDHRNATTLKRGRGALHFPLQHEEASVLPSAESPEKMFQIEWAGAVLQQSLRDLERECLGDEKEVAFRAFFIREIHPPGGIRPSYQALAERLGVSVDDVRNYLHRIRNRFRELVWNRVRQTVGSDEDAEAELRDLFKAVRP